jgi:hypothetical protein
MSTEKLDLVEGEPILLVNEFNPKTFKARKINWESGNYINISFYITDYNGSHYICESYNIKKTVLKKV